MSVYAPLLGNLWRTLESYSLDPGQVIDQSLFRPGNDSAYVERVSFAEYDAALAHAASLINDPTVGIRSAQYLHPSHLGAFGHAWLASACLRTALLRASRFHRMFNEQIDMQVEELSDRVRVTYRMLRQPTHPNLMGDALLASLLQLCRMNFGMDLEPVEVRLKRPLPPDPSPWFEYFGVKVQFEQPENSLSISARDADTPLTGSNSELVTVHEDVIRRHLMKLDRNSVLNRSRLGIMEQLPSGRVTQDTLADVLNMSKRTLHRKLRENDETFRSLLAQVRMDLAKRYISDDDYSFTEIAFLLGYTDSSAFSRAFRSWFGHSPTQARERNRAA
jgi:AraC-like DNA-binding protein